MQNALIIDDDEDYRKLMSVKLRRAYPDIHLTEIDPLAMTMPGDDYAWDEACMSPPGELDKPE